MSDSERSSLLASTDGDDRNKNKMSAYTTEEISYTTRSTSYTTTQSTSYATEETQESTPLLTGSNATPRYDGEHDERSAVEVASLAPNASDSRSPKPTKGKSTRWPSVIAVIVLSLITAAIIVFAFFVPAAVEEYAKEAAMLEPTNLSLQSITTAGIRARIQANFRLDGQRVNNEHVRRVGRLTGWLVGKLESEETRIDIYLPEYDNILLGSAVVPPQSIRVTDGSNTPVDFVADLMPGDADGIRTIANEWLQGRLDKVRFMGKADVQLKTGILPLGTHTIVDSMTFEASKLPKLPEYNITRLNFEEKPIPGHAGQAMGVEVSLTAFNEYPVSVDVPELGFEVLVPGCSPYDPYILIAAAKTSPVAVRSHAEVVADVHGLVKELPAALTNACPDSTSSPLDIFFAKYLDGESATIFVRGQKDREAGAPDTPDWLADILSSITVPVAFPGRSFDNLIRSFSLTDAHFTLPDPDDPDADLKVSGTIQVLAALPSEMNFSLNVSNVRANADVYYKKKELGKLDLSKWQAANSTQLPAGEDAEAMLRIQSRIEDAPLNVTDADVLTDVIEALLFGGEDVILTVVALVDVKVQTILGQLVVKGVPAEGKIPLKPLPRDTFKSLEPQASDIQVIESTSSSLLIKASVSISNPTPYSAHIPYISIHVLSNGTIVGEATAKNLDITTGNNTNLAVTALWNPSMGGALGPQRARDLLSQYISGYNTSVTLRTYRGSIPSQPLLGEALSKINFTVLAPRLNLPGGNEDDKTHFIRDAVFHVFSSTATFTLVSPLRHNTLYIDHVNATALYNHTEPMGRIAYDLPFAAPPGSSQTPKLPVDWSLDSVGYQKLKEALGGKMKLDARATVGVRVGEWTETVWYVGKGIGASVRI